MKKSLIAIALLIGVVNISFTVKNTFQSNPWNVPDKDKNAKNPLAGDAGSISEGKELWNTHCKSCHGAKGLGDGPKAAQLKTEPGDFSKPAVQSQPDGALYYKLTEGRDDMPSFKKKLPEAEERWALVNFIRSLKK